MANTVGVSEAETSGGPCAPYNRITSLFTWAKSCSKSSAYKSMSTPSAILVMLFGRGTREARRRQRRQHTHTHAARHAHKPGGDVRWSGERDARGDVRCLQGTMRTVDRQRSGFALWLNEIIKAQRGGRWRRAVRTRSRCKTTRPCRECRCSVIHTAVVSVDKLPELVAAMSWSKQTDLAARRNVHDVVETTAISIYYLVIFCVVDF